MTPMWNELRRLAAYRDLLYFLVVMDIKRRYRQSLMGVIWVLFQPFALTVVFVAVFSRWYRQSGGEDIPYPLFAYAGLAPWMFFSRSLQAGVPRLVMLSSLLKKINFPRSAIPASSVFTAGFDLALALLGLAALKLYYGSPWHTSAMALPLVFIMEALLALGLTQLLSALNVYYRDVQFALPFLLQMGLLASPIIYRKDQLPAALQSWYWLNPMAGITGLYRWMFLQTPLDAAAVAASAAAALLFFAVGSAVFSVLERRFADVV